MTITSGVPSPYFIKGTTKSGKEIIIYFTREQAREIAESARKTKK